MRFIRQQHAIPLMVGRRVQSWRAARCPPNAADPQAEYARLATGYNRAAKRGAANADAARAARLCRRPRAGGTRLPWVTQTT